jgi:hypothetical protein
VPAVNVLGDLDAVLRWILAEAAARLPLHHPSYATLRTGGPPPRDELVED